MSAEKPNHAFSQATLEAIKTSIVSAIACQRWAEHAAHNLITDHERDVELRSLPSAKSFADAAMRSHVVNDGFLRLFGETTNSFTGPLLLQEGHDKLNSFWWQCALAASATGTAAASPNSESGASITKESACRAVMDGLFLLAHWSNAVVNWWERNAVATKEDTGEQAALYSARELAGYGKIPLRLPACSDSYIEAKVLRELAYVAQSLTTQDVHSDINISRGNSTVPDGEWLIPTSLSDMANRLGNVGTKKVRTMLDTYGLKTAGNRQLWTVRLDGMPANMREKLEQGR